jgi:hypothetical protein
MSQRVAYPQTADLSEGKRRFQELLKEALNLADELALPAEIGAKLQEVIDLTEISGDALR